MTLADTFIRRSEPCADAPAVSDQQRSSSVVHSGTLMVPQSEASAPGPPKNGFAAFGRIAYRLGAAFLIFLVAAAAGGAIGLVWVGPDAEGWDAFGAAIWGMLVGGIMGGIAAVGSLFAPLPRNVVTRWIIVAVLAGLFFAALGTQEVYD